MAQNRAKKMQIGKAKNFKKAIKNLFQFSKKYLPIIIIALTLSVIASVLAVIGPNKLRDLTNEIQLGIMGTINMTNILNIMYVLIAVYLTSSTFMAVQNLIMAKVSKDV